MPRRKNSWYSSNGGPCPEVIKPKKDEKNQQLDETVFGKCLKSNEKADPFYPNAIQCLITLFRTEYKKMENKNEQQVKAMKVWENIAEYMNACYFVFNCEQIKHKYAQLRQHYFNLSTLKEINAFTYFDQLHEIYHDKRVDAIAVGKKVFAVKLYDEEPPSRDDVLFQDDNIPEQEECYESPEQAEVSTDWENQESDDMIPPPPKRFNSKIPAQVIYSLSPELAKSIKRNKSEAEHSDRAPSAILQTNVIPSSAVRVVKITPLPSESSGKINDLTMAEYNAQEERRHQDKMELMKRSIELQEQAIEENRELKEILKLL